jgi:BlaI family transcriptional regulator, penicillinase repressor
MSRPKISRLGTLQLRIMKILWARPETSVADVHAALGTASDHAYTTIATMLRKMETRGLVTHRTEGRTFLYQAALGEDAITRGLAEDLVDRVFEGNLAEMVAHLLTRHEVSREELNRLEKLIAERKKQK